jgi:LPPG:FO 2-phospho-L-lactate transferase
MTAVVCLAGGVGGAKLAEGLQAELGPDLAVVVNTADDSERHGLLVCADHDTVMYTLAGIENPDHGWGLAGDTWNAMEALERYGEEAWFRLGDRDLATHVVRTARLRDGERLTVVCRALQARLGVRAAILPMTDEPVRTHVRTDAGWLDFQDYFVRRHFADEVRQVRFDGIEAATAAPGVLDAVGSADLIVIAPSNPFVSVGPILAVPDLLDAIMSAGAQVLAVSPIVSGSALRGPAGAMLASLAGEGGAAGIARYYARQYPGLLDVFVVDVADAAEAAAVAGTRLAVRVEQTVLTNVSDRMALAQALLPRTMRA